jgi:hypothetical protein
MLGEVADGWATAETLNAEAAERRVPATTVSASISSSGGVVKAADGSD